MKSFSRLACLLIAASIASCMFSPSAGAQSPAAAPTAQAEATIPAQSSGRFDAASSASTLTIPGSLRSFLRMAGISQKVSLPDVLPLLARNVEIQGYHGSQEKPGSPTEFLILLERYVNQAKELQALAGTANVIHVSGCDDAQALLTILGYRFHEACGQNVSLETEDAERAFLTIDSGFPLADLEGKLRKGEPFNYPYSGTQVPVLFTPRQWTAYDKNVSEAGKEDLLESLLHNRGLSRLYWGMSQLDQETRVTLEASPGLRRLLRSPAALDFYGSHISVRSGRVVVPGGAAAESAWKELVGASPDAPSEFVSRLLARDEGWLAAYFDALSRISQTQQTYFTEPHHLRLFYEALRGHNTSPSAIAPVFRPDAGPLLLMTRLELGPNGEPEVPGNLEVWQDIIHQKNDSREGRDWVKQASRLHSPEQLVEAMFAFSRQESSDAPLQVYLMLSEMDRGRSPEQRLSPQTVRLLASDFSRYGDQYLIFSEFPGLGNDAITRFLSAMQSIDHVSNPGVRANAIGLFQANIGLWQILARQGEISSEDLNDSWQKVIQPFTQVNSSVELFDAGHASLRALFQAAADRSALSEDEFIDVLAGPNQTSRDGRQVRGDLSNAIRSVMVGQRLASFDTLFALGDGLNQLAQGKTTADSLLPLAGELHEFELPRTMFTSGEREEWAPGVPSNRHTSLQAKTDLAKIIKSTSSQKELTEARGLLTPFLRDTLVGLNYAYYEPPGAQMLHNNSLFVRSHDFSGQMTVGKTQSWQVPSLFGSGLPAAGGAHLAGSLANLPFVLAKAEQDFIVPENVQALIWPELVPGLMSSAVLPRWWGVSRNELHAVTLYQRTGEELLNAAADNPKLRQTVMKILSDRLAPERSERIENELAAGHLKEALAGVMPGETFYLAAEFRREFPAQTDSWGVAGQELDGLSHRDAGEVSWERLSRDFGVPHPALAQSYARELLDVKPFPALMGYGSILLAESWDSNNLYWARLADEMGYSPVMLNRLVPQLTHRMIEKIFATDFEDWPAILRAMRETGEEFRQGKIASLQTNGPS